ncbi:MAG: (d)CMP kinase [Firmicutes bacterium]|nr:(d)CMP kinase [Bacillota bacterium]
MSDKSRRLRVAIDGPAGAGKSTVAREVSKRLKLKYLDTGAMYRAITLKVHREKIDLANLETLKEMLDRTTVQIGNDKKVFLDGEDVTEEIRMSHVNDLVSPVSCISLVRKRLVAMQQAIANESDRIIMEGRDIGSRVMPDAEFKFYLDASLEERARRRNKEQLEKKINLSLDEVAAEIKRRDEIDSGRADSPLTRVEDAVLVDTTAMSFDEVVDSIIRKITEQLH